MLLSQKYYFFLAFLYQYLFNMFFLKTLTYIAGVIRDQAEAELDNPEKIKAQLIALQNQLDANEIGEDEYDEEETELLDRLDEIRKNSKTS